MSTIAPLINDTVAPVQIRSKLACAACRQNKVRCLRHEGLDHTCMRCLRYGLACTPPESKKRGRPRRESSDRTGNVIISALQTKPSTSAKRKSPKTSGGLSTNMSNQIQNLNGITNFSPQHNQHVTFSPDIRLNNHDQIVDSDHHFDHSQQTAFNHDQFTYDITEPSPLSSEAEASANNRNLDLSEYLDPSDRPLQLNQTNAPFFLDYMTKATETETSPISRSEFRDDPDRFHDRLNHLVAVLDVKLHSLTYLRCTSTVLFTAVIAAANYHDLDVLEITGGHVFVEKDWNSDSDGISVILACSKDGATAAGRDDGEKDTERRENLDVLSYTTGLPIAIQPNHFMDAGNWAREHTYLGPLVDLHLASSIELCKLKDQWRVICDSTFQSAAYNEAALDSVHDQCEALLTRYWRKEAPPVGFEYEKEHVGLWATLDFMLVLKRHHLEASPNDPIRIDACLKYASRITDEIDTVANNGDLEIMQDTSSVMASSLTVLLRKIFHLASVTQKILIITLLQRILNSYTKASGAEVNTASAYVARFVQRTLRAIGMESKAASPIPIIDGTMDSTIVEDVQPDFMAQLQEFMMVPEENTGLNDEDYW
ncbi:uncharacterized protein L201_007550 [Kwoniella dendrophila CBS 6074]|uniref:Zn(2)-C6 fungal-type domain-containing protein n=1 Tax=Kwoniella dendrophila CBS 6074 TaxID=1295534 RepID=A0AAX4K4D6_9TREE